ncbi:MAG: DUF1559 domain-containing protein, partial [Planctomycetales bacterium]|nr:DUF1559 domain-containing protein [Planctomycetales bacterium]
QNLYNLVDFNIYMGHPGLNDLPTALHAAAATAVPFFFCPSDGENQVHSLTMPSGAVIPVAGSNYAMNQGSGMDKMFHPSLGTADGLCWNDAKIKFASITDGTSNTLAFTESLRGPVTKPTSVAGTHAEMQRFRGAVSPSDALLALADAGNLPAMLSSIPSWNAQRLMFWLRGTSPDGPVMNGRFAPNAKTPDLVVGSSKATAARSNHTGGVEACYADGSVHFISDSIDAVTWHAIWTRSGGEVVSTPE